MLPKMPLFPASLSTMSEGVLTSVQSSRPLMLADGRNTWRKSVSCVRVGGGGKVGQGDVRGQD